MANSTVDLFQKGQERDQTLQLRQGYKVLKILLCKIIWEIDQH